MSHPRSNVTIALIVIAVTVLATASVWSAEITPGYGGAGVWPQAASANSERYFRFILEWNPDNETPTTFSLGSVRLYDETFTTLGSCTITGGAFTSSDPFGRWQVSSYPPASNAGIVLTIGPFAARNYVLPGNPLPNGVVGEVYHTDTGGTDPTARFRWATSSGSDSDSVTINYITAHNNDDYLQWYTGDAAGVDPLSVDTATVDPDDGSGSSRYRFRVMYHTTYYNLRPRTERHEYPPGGRYSYSVWNRNTDTFYRRGDHQYDAWTYDQDEDPHTVDNIGWTRNWPSFDPTVVLIIDGDRTRPRFMHPEDPNDTNYNNGAVFYYDILPTDYKRYLENVFLFPYDPAGPDPTDESFLYVKGRSLSNNYVSFGLNPNTMSVGGHTYEFIATDDFSPANDDNAWLQVGRPGNGLYNQFMRTYHSGYMVNSVDLEPADPSTESVYTRWLDGDGVGGGAGYPYDSQNPNRYPNVNPVLTAHPFFTRSHITPGSSFNPDPAGIEPNPFTPETGPGPHPPLRYTNDDTILPNYVNIQPETAATPFIGGRWTNQERYTFRINYWQSDSVPPSVMKVFIRKVTPTEQGTWSGGTWQGFTMEQRDPGDRDYTDGCVFQFQATPQQLPGGGGPGDYNYYFQASDGSRTTIFPNRPGDHDIPGVGTVRDPGTYGVPASAEGEDYYWFRVNTPPTLSNESVDPVAGNTGANFRYTVTYADQDGAVLDSAANGDRPFRGRIHIDLFGNPQGNPNISTVVNAQTIEYDPPDGDGYGTNALAGMQLRMLSGTAADQVFPITANTDTEITTSGDFQTAGVAAGDTFRIEDWFTAEMAQANPSAQNYSGGVVCEFNTATNVELGPGTHRYYFEFVDDWATWLFPDDQNVKVLGETVRHPESGFIQGPEVTANSAPILSDFRFTPKSTTEGEADGTTATSFVFFVTYTDADNDPPAFIRLALDGTAQSPDRILELKPDPPGDTVYTDGVAYKSDPIKLAAGEHQFYGQASDGDARYPDADPGDPLIYVGPVMPQNPDPDDPPDANSDGYQDYVVGPTVAENTPPTLSFPADDDGSDPDDPPGLDPNKGQETTQFTYTVIYTDSDRFAGQAGNPPKFVRVFIDGEQHDMTPTDPQDTDYTNGATYTLEGVTLAEGTPHTYFFLASDDLDTARLPELGQVENDRYEGPVVDEPPAEPLNLLAQDRPNDNGGVINLEFSASADDGGGARDVTEYRVYRTETEGNYTDPPVLTVPATQSASYMVQDTSAVTDQAYFYVVRAYDGVNESANSNEEGPVTAIDNIPPQPPSNVQVTDPGLGGTLVVTWNLSPDDGGGQNDVVEYHIYRRTESTTYTPPPVGTVEAGETEFVDSTVPHGTGENFYYTVRAFDGSNESENAPEAGAEPPTDTQPPVVVDVQPADGARNVDLQPTISFAVEDTGAGVDINTVSLFINGNPVPADDLTIEGSPDRYDISYDVPDPFDYQQNVRVRVTAEDIDGNAGEAKWSFLTRGRPTSSVSGTVTESDGTGVPNVTVRAGEISTTTNAQGEYTIEGLADGTYQVTAQLSGWYIAPPQIAVTVPPDASGISFTAQPGFAITGTVVDEDNQPMQGVQVAAGERTDITDDQGEYALADLPAGTYQVVPSLEGFEFDPALRNVEIGPGVSGAGTDFTASVETHALSGQVETSTGERMKNVNVTAENLDTGETTVEPTGISGQYTFPALPRGRYRVTPTTSGYQFKPTSREIELFAPKSDVNFVGVPLYGVQLPEGINFVSVPIDPETTDFRAAFGANSQVARWDGVNERWITEQTPNNPILDLAPARGYFVRTQQAGTSFVPGAPISTDVGFDLDLTINWNMVGNPYPAPLPWSQIGVAPGGTVKDYGFIYDRDIDDYRLVADVTGYGIVDTIPEEAGFWMHTDTARTVRITAPATTAATEPAMTFGDGDYLIPVQAVSAGTSDGCAAAGVVADAAAMPGGGQIINPPAKGAGVDLYFVGDDGRKLSYDVRTAGSDSHSWEFEVATTADAPVTVALPDLSAVPADQQVTLVDTVTDKRIYARTMRGYTYDASADQARRFRLEVADRTAAALVVSSATAQAEGGQVTLSYALSQPASVSVNVMNISGRLIRTVAAGQARSAGVNTETWDLRNADGAMVPSGKYLMCIRATADNGQQVQSVVPVQVMR